MSTFISLILTFWSSSHLWATNKTSKIPIPKISVDPGPVEQMIPTRLHNLGFSADYSSNFSRNSNNSDPQVTYQTTFNTTFTHPSRLGNWTFTPDLTLRLTPEEEVSNVNGNEIRAFLNTQFSWQKSQDTTVNFTNSSGYDSIFAFNDNQEFTKEEYIETSFGTVLITRFTNILDLNGSFNVKVRDYTSVTSFVQPDEQDFLDFKFNMTPGFQLKESLRFSVPFSINQTQMRTRKSLLSTGAEGGSKAETQTFFSLLGRFDYIYKGLGLAFHAGLRNNVDSENSGKSFTGADYGINVSFDHELINISNQIRSRDNNYETQLVNRGTVENDDLFEFTKLQVISNITLKSLIWEKDIWLKYAFTELDGNRENRDFIDQVLSIGINLVF